MREKLIENHNSLVKKGDRVYHLGDMFWRTVPMSEAMDIVARLNGQHYYIYGNHDELFKNPSLRNRFIWCRDVENLKVEGHPNIYLHHYACEEWNGSHKGSYHLFGHVHGEKKNPVGLKFDVGVDAQNYFPISLEDVTAKMKEKAKAFQGKNWTCECGNAFHAVDTAPKLCSKCTGTMELK